MQLDHFVVSPLSEFLLRERFMFKFSHLIESLVFRTGEEIIMAKTDINTNRIIRNIQGYSKNI